MTRVWWSIIKSWIWLDSLCRRENLCCSKVRIVLNSELKTSAILTYKFFFERMAAVVGMAEYVFFWTNYPILSSGIPIDLEQMTNSKQLMFSHSNRYILVYFMWEVITKKSKKSKVYSWGFDCSFKNELCDWSTWLAREFLASQVTILAEQCPLTGCYFEPWPPPILMPSILFILRGEA